MVFLVYLIFFHGRIFIGFNAYDMFIGILFTKFKSKCLSWFRRLALATIVGIISASDRLLAVISGTPAP